MGDERGAEETAMGSLRQGSTDSQAVEAYYDGWAEAYDATLRGWNYRAPAETAETLAGLLAPGAHVLDVGCGTGLVGAALSETLDCTLDGIDISLQALSIAASGGHYAGVTRHDLQQVPLPAESDRYDAAVCIGVMTYIARPTALLRDLCRVVRGGGLILFTHRSDLWQEQDFDRVLEALTAEGLWEAPQVRRDRAYLPDNEDFGDEIRVHHVLARVA
jgi:predicted TPR repeat methyltransferase